MLLASGCAGSCTRGVPILMYHSISEADDHYAVSPADFAAQLDWLKAAGFTTVSLRQLFDHEDRGAPLPARPIVLTFDDGYQDNLTAALPLLRARGQSATIFVVTSFIGEDEQHRRIEEPGTPREKRYLIWPEVKALAAVGIEIGAHARTHRKLPDLPDDEVRAEAKGAREDILRHLGALPDVFAYPYNSDRANVRRVVEEAGYRGAVSGAGRFQGGRFHRTRVGVYRGMGALHLRERLAEGWDVPALDAGVR